MFATSAALTQDVPVFGKWIRWAMPPGVPAVGAGFKHDDGGTLVIACDPSRHLMSYALGEPRANWQRGSTIEVTTRADDGTQAGASKGIVLTSTALTVLEQSTWDIYVMGKSKAFFAMGVGGYERIFPVADFRATLDPVLQACNDHW